MTEADKANEGREEKPMYSKEEIKLLYKVLITGL